MEALKTRVLALEAQLAEALAETAATAARHEASMHALIAEHETVKTAFSTRGALVERVHANMLLVSADLEPLVHCQRVVARVLADLSDLPTRSLLL